MSKPSEAAIHQVAANAAATAAPADPNVPNVVDIFAQAIATAVKALQPPREVSFDDYEPRGPFNPTGKKNRELPCVVYQNGVKLREAVLHDAELDLLHRLLSVKAGRYINGLVTLIHDDATGAGDRVMKISYDHGTLEKRLMLRNEFANFRELLERLVAEGEAIQA